MRRPRVVVNMVMTADGKTASALRGYPRLGSSEDRRRMEELRARADAVLVGAETVRAIDPPLHVREAGAVELRSSLGKPAGLVHVVLTRSGRVPLEARALAEPSAVASVVATTARGAARLAEAGTRVEVWELGADEVDLSLLMQRLDERGVERLLVEGGGETNWSLLAAGLLDELFVTIAPALLGGRSAPTPFGGPGLPVGGRVELELAELERVGAEIFCHYVVRR